MTGADVIIGRRSVSGEFVSQAQDLGVGGGELRDKCLVPVDLGTHGGG